MDLSSKDAEILESVADTTKSVQELADDNMKRVAVRLAANCYKFKKPPLDDEKNPQELLMQSLSARARIPCALILIAALGGCTESARLPRRRSTRVRH